MSNAWDVVAKMAEQSANAGGIYVRLVDDGDRVVGVFVGDPHAIQVHWTGEGYAECSGHSCPLCESLGKKPSLRVMINFFDIAENAMKIIEGGILWYQNIMKVREKYGLNKWSFEIQRQGAKGDSKTRYTILPDSQIDTDLRSKIAKCELHDLGAPPRRPEAETEAEPATPGKIAELVGRLKSLPIEQAKSLLADAGITRVKEMTAEQARSLDRALSAVDPVHGLDIDPFA
jgi:hypothetical protein